MSYKKWVWVLLLGLLSLPLALAQDDEDECEMEPDTRVFTASFVDQNCRFRNRYFPAETAHPYWSLEPGWQVVLEGEEDDEVVTVAITVLDETEVVNGIRCRVVEEREWIDDELYEVSRNFFAFCHRTNDMYYFGEDVDFYEDGEIVNHDGAWRAGEDGATAGIILPGTALVGARFHQEFAADVAEDRAEILDITTVEMDGVTYDNVLILAESSPLDGPCDVSEKWFAPGIGMIRDEELMLVDAGFAFEVAPYIPLKQDE